MIFKISKNFFILLIFGMMVWPTRAEIIIVNNGDNLNEILNSAKGGDTILIEAGSYKRVYISEKNFTPQKPLVIRGIKSETVTVYGNTVSNGSAIEIKNCSYIIVEGISLTNAMWGIYVKNSEHILIRNNEIFKTGQEGCHVGRSSKFVDIIGNEIHHTGLFNSKWAEGNYIGSGSYSGSNFPDNCEYIWIEDNHIYETGNAEGINVKGECFHVTVRSNIIHNIRPGTREQYNQAAITVEGGENSIKNKFRISEKRDVWVENNTIDNVSDGYADWNNGIMFFGTGVYILNNTVKNCTNKGILGNNWKDLGLQNHVYGNSIINCAENMVLHSDLKIIQSNPGENPHSPQKWYANF